MIVCHWQAVARVSQTALLAKVGTRKERRRGVVGWEAED